MTGEGLGGEPAEHPGEDAGQDRAERKEDDKDLIDKARDRLTGR